MKKTIAVLLAAVLILSFVACGGGASKDSLVVTWEVTSAKVDGGELLVGTVLKFNSDDTYSWTMSGYTLMSGKYKLSGSFLYLDDEKELVSISGNTMTIKDSTGEMSLIKK